MPYLEALVAGGDVDGRNVHESLTPCSSVGLEEVTHGEQVCWLHIERRLSCDNNPTCYQAGQHRFDRPERPLRLREC